MTKEATVTSFEQGDTSEDAMPLTHSMTAWDMAVGMRRRGDSRLNFTAFFSHSVRSDVQCLEGGADAGSFTPKHQATKLLLACMN